MSPEEQFEDLTKRVARLEESFRGGVEIIQNIGGGDRMYQAVITGLVESHPDPVAMAEVVRFHLERQYTSIHFETLPEAHVSGAQAAYTWLSAVVDNALKRPRTQG